MSKLPEYLRRPAVRFKRRLDRLTAERPPAQVFELPSEEALGLGDDVAGYLRTRRSPRLPIEPREIRRALGLIERERPAWRHAAMAEAAALAEHRIAVYGREARLGSPESWLKLPLGPGADLLYRQRPHRFAFAPRLALAALYGAPARATLKQLIESWVQVTYGPANPLGYGSAHVAVHRALALIWTLCFLTADEGPDDGLVPLILRILLSDLRFIASRQPTATPNNHLMAESFALWLFATLFPEAGEARQWRMTGQEAFLTQLARQVYEDGTSFEHSLHYHEHACEVVATYLAVCRRNALPVADWILARARAMAAFQSTMTGPEGAPLALGGAIEDPLLPLDGGGGWAPGAWRLLAHALFDRTIAPPAESDTDLGARILAARRPGRGAAADGSDAAAAGLSGLSRGRLLLLCRESGRKPADLP